MVDEYRAERTISAVFKEQEQLDQVVRRLMDRGVPQDHISVMGKNFQSKTRIAGFITKRDVVFGGLRSGAVFGSLFGSFLALLTGVGVLFIPFVGPVVAAGPLGALLLGAASGAIAGSAGAGLVSALVAWGMPEEKATIYQTRVEAGEFLVMAEVPANKSGEFQLLLESAGGEEVHTTEMTLPRACPGRCNEARDLSPEVRSHLSEQAQTTFMERYNTVFDETEDPMKAEQAAWETVHQQYEEDENGVWSKQKATV
ncbi:ChaB family protein [Allocoleopsis franciscana]|uniref:Putative cation transport regulator n=1 Tax=Allocoleopsis franciscana PCC 7113 TaxID=1173027 RepID=K9WJ17_9CYAN|nr:ChaB family protein [Allocoleopsis franciscana]AFZ19769.1 putative cation transport regulator [Allocoleopsis franciscana PCC 7113]